MKDLCVLIADIGIIGLNWTVWTPNGNIKTQDYSQPFLELLIKFQPTRDLTVTFLPLVFLHLILTISISLV